MRRIIIAILVFGSLGLAATVGISWWLAIDLQRSTYLNAGAYPVVWQWPGVLVHRNDARPPEVRERGDNIEYQRMDEQFDPPYWSALRDVPDDGTRRVVEVATGWPLKTLRMVGEGEGSFTEGVHVRFDGALIGDLALSRFGRNTRPITRLPVKPIWLNLFVSVAVWAVLCGLVLNMPRVLRVLLWHVRKKRRRCGMCGYDVRVRTGGICSECGHEFGKPPRWIGAPSIAGAMLVLVVVLTAETLLLVQFLSHQPIKDIHWAAARGDYEGVRAALEKGADVNEPIRYFDYPNRMHSEQNTTALMLACSRSDVEMVRILLDTGADPNLPWQIDWSKAPSHLWGIVGERMSPLHIAAKQGSFEVASLLVDAGAALGATASGSDTPLDLAIQGNHTEVVEFLLSDEQFNKESPTYLQQALWVAVWWSPQYVDALLEAGADPSGALGRAIARGHVDAAAKLLEAGAEIDFQVMSAAVVRDMEAVEFLLSHGGRLRWDDPGGWTLFFQSGSSDWRVWEALIDAGVDVNSRSVRDGRTALMNAASSHNASLVKFLLEHGADPTLADADGKIALDYAGPGRPPSSRSLHDRAQTIQYLLEQAIRGAEPIHPAVSDDPGGVSDRPPGP